MPLYDYDCAACGHRVEVMHGVHAEGPATCPSCGSDRVRKAFAAPAVHFKGSGWAKKERRATVTSGSNKSNGSDAAGRDGGGTGADSGGTGGSDGGGSANGDGDRSSSDATPAPITASTATTPASAGAATGSD